MLGCQRIYPTGGVCLVSAHSYQVYYSEPEKQTCSLKRLVMPLHRLFLPRIHDAPVKATGSPIQSKIFVGFPMDFTQVFAGFNSRVSVGTLVTPRARGATCRRSNSACFRRNLLVRKRRKPTVVPWDQQSTYHWIERTSSSRSKRRRDECPRQGNAT